MKPGNFIATILILLGLTSFLRSQTINIDSTFTSDGEIFPFQQNDTIYGLSLTGQAILKSDSSFVRIIYRDLNGNEFMMLETYPLIASNDTVNIEGSCDETCFFEDSYPVSIVIHTVHSDFYLESLAISYDNMEDAGSLQYQAKRSSDFDKIGLMNQNIIQVYNLNWQAGDNDVIRLYYHQKKERFGEKYNLNGFDYYKNGIYEKPNSGRITSNDLALIRNFDWRTRHGANNSTSQYYDGDDTTYSGWLTVPKLQLCGSCWAYSTTGLTEALYNLYFNNNTEINLSEGHLIACVPGSGCNGGQPINALDFIESSGIVTEYFFPDPGTDTIPCDSIPIQPDTVIKINGSDYIASNHGIDSVKKGIIEFGPMEWTILDYTHSISLIGFLFNPLDSSTTWIIKNSFGTGWGQKGFGYYNDSEIGGNSSVKYIKLPVIEEEMPVTNEVQCRDEDGDGYYFWGLGTKPDSCPECPDLPDCDDSNPFLGPFDENYYCSCLFSYDSVPLYITSDTTWNEPVYLEKDIIIDSGITLTIKDIAAFVEGAGIYVKKGGTLYLDGCRLTKACKGYWKGVEVRGDPNLPQLPYSNQGRVWIKSNASVEFAEIGILLGKVETDSSFGYGGGILQAENARFYNNITGVEFYPYTNTQYSPMSYFKDVDFISYDSAFTLEEPFASVLLRNTLGIKFEGCTFEHKDAYLDLNPYNHGIGILSYNSAFRVVAGCASEVYPCPEKDSSRFLNLTYGIRAFNDGANRFVEVEDAVFFRNERGMYLSGLTDPEIVSNKFYCHRVPPGVPGRDLDEIVYGLYLDGCTGYHIENNEFYEKYQNGATGILNVGMFVYNSGSEANEIYNNIFHNIRLGMAAYGENRGEETGLCIKCNDFWTNLNDIWVYPDTSKNRWQQLQGIAPYQGDPNDTTGKNLAGNTFTYFQGNPWGEYDYNMINDENCEHITYVHHMRQINPHTWPKNINDTTQITLIEKPLIEFDKLLHCPSTLNGSGSIEELRGILDSTGVALASVETDISTYTDGGDTDELNSDVLFSQPNQSMELRQQLLNDSPYLSDTVMKSSIQKEDVLPNAMIRDVLIVNPQSAKSGKILQKLNDRTDPMPDYMMGQIMQGVSTLGAKEILGAERNHWSRANYTAFNDITRFYQKDTAILNVSDSLIAYLQNINKPHAKYRLAMEYLECEDFESAGNVLDNLQLEGYQEEIRLAYIDYLDIMESLHNAGKSIYEMDSTEVSGLIEIVNSKLPLISAFARNTLVAADKLDYSEPISFPVVLKAAYVEYPDPPAGEAQSDSYIKIFPVPANDYCIVEFSLPANKNMAELKISDVNGKTVKSIKLLKSMDQQVIPLGFLSPGTYMFRLIVDGVLLDSQKISIIR